MQLRPIGWKSSLRVVGPEYDLIDLGPVACPCAHLTGLERHVESAFPEVLSTQVISCRRKGLHFGVGGDVGQSFG